MFTWAGPLAALGEPLEPVEPEGAEVPTIGVLVPLYSPPPEAGVLVLEVEPDEPEELPPDDGLVGQRALPVTGTTGVVVPMLVIGVDVPRAPPPLAGVDVPKAPPPLAGVDVPTPVLGATVPVLEVPGVDVPELKPEVAASVETEVDKLWVPCPVLGIAAVPVAPQGSG